jgi:hypothetical protein
MIAQRTGWADLNAQAAERAFVVDDLNPPTAQEDGIKRAERDAGRAFETESDLYFQLTNIDILNGHLLSPLSLLYREFICNYRPRSKS